jgi:hypothetical protein
MSGTSSSREQIRLLSRDNVIVAACLSAADHHGYSWEQALEMMVIHLAKQNNECHRLLVEASSAQCPVRFYVKAAP